ncbi:hypothetical protein LCGC14_2180420, partial [marine sediment metagenome]
CLIIIKEVRSMKGISVAKIIIIIAILGALAAWVVPRILGY